MKKFIVPLLLLILAAIIAAYAFNGGFSAVEITQKQSTQKFIVGKAYEGEVRSRKFANLFQEAGQLIETGKLKGNPGGIYYNNPSDAKGKIKAFIGVVVKDPNIQLPEGYQLRELTAGQQVLQARLEAHSSLIPGKVYPALFEHAEENNLKLKEEYFEEYFSMREGILQVPLVAEP